VPPPTRLATVDDADELTRLRSLMFEAMGRDTSSAAWRAACAAHFRTGLSGGGHLAGIVVEDAGGGLAACGIIEFVDRIPSPHSPSGRWAYISTISTDPAHRRRGMAAAVMDGLLGPAHARRLDRVELHATELGRPLYERLGFRLREGAPEMTLSLLHPPP
jgi:ribosomal protein S18 acetylase RimI-like enzyme